MQASEFSDSPQLMDLSIWMQSVSLLLDESLKLGQLQNVEVAVNGPHPITGSQHCRHTQDMFKILMLLLTRRVSDLYSLYSDPDSAYQYQGSVSE
jgi:hypothetical protein